jgi:hypothetical protein
MEIEWKLQEGDIIVNKIYEARKMQEELDDELKRYEV